MGQALSKLTRNPLPCLRNGPVVIRGYEYQSVARSFNQNHLRCTHRRLALGVICVSVLALWYLALIHVHSITSTLRFVSGLRDLGDFAAPSLVWKFGIAMLCDKHDDIEYVLTENDGDGILSVDRFSGIEDGDVLWIKDFQLMDFVERILPQIEGYFSLVMATNRAQITPLYFDEDREYREKQIFDRLLSNKFLLRIFTENYDGTMGSAMIEGIPIGLDLHTPFIRPFASWFKLGEFGPPAVYDDTIKRLTARSMPFKERKMLIYLDSAITLSVDSASHYLKEWEHRFGRFWQRSPDQFTRTLRDEQSDEILAMYKDRDHLRKHWYRSWFVDQIEHHLDPETRALFFMDSDHHSQTQLFMKRAEFVFVFSPFGNGLDCHRLWESLIFSNIVIVQSSPMDELFIAHDLPVVIVQNLHEITEQKLKEWFHRFEGRVYANNATTRYKMTNAYWAHYIKQKTMTLETTKRTDKMKSNT